MTANRLALLASTRARDLMVHDPMTVSGDAEVGQAISLLTEKASAAAAVVNQHGAPIGVVSRSDLLVHGKYQSAMVNNQVPHEQLRVRDIMTPCVFAVSPDTTAKEVITELVAHNILQVFVVAEDKNLVGVIHALDVLRHFD